MSMKSFWRAATGLALVAASIAGSNARDIPEALRLAGLLAKAAEQATQPQQKQQFAATLAALEASGIVAATDEPDPFPAWRAQLAPSADQAPLRGRTLGAAFRRGTLSAGQSLEFRQGFLAGQLAEVAVVTGSAGRLSLEVIEDGGRTICRSRSAVRQAACRWIPTFSGASIVRLSNGDRAATGFVLVLR